VTSPTDLWLGESLPEPPLPPGLCLEGWKDPAEEKTFGSLRSTGRSARLPEGGHPYRFAWMPAKALVFWIWRG